MSHPSPPVNTFFTHHLTSSLVAPVAPLAYNQRCDALARLDYGAAARSRLTHEDPPLCSMT
jgi:hypothetical protein